MSEEKFGFIRLNEHDHLVLNVRQGDQPEVEITFTKQQWEELKENGNYLFSLVKDPKQLEMEFV